MYKEFTIPEQKYKTCGLCPHYSSRLLKSGRNPIREYYCNHPNFDNYEDFMSSISGKRDGRKIGENSNTPKWCPFLPQANGKRNFSQITPSECLAVSKIAKPTCFVNPKIKWKVVNADKDVYTFGGYSVKSKDNWFQFDFDFEMENISIWDNKYPDADSEKIDMQSHFEIVQLLNSKKIFFEWQSVTSI